MVARSVAALWLLAVFALSAQTASAQSQPTPPAFVRATRAVPFSVDFDERLWHFTPLEMTDISARVPTADEASVALLYDDRALYVAARLTQHAPVTAVQTVNDVGFGLDDFFGIGIDTSGNGEQSYYFEVTPGGTRYQQAFESVRYKPAWRALSARSATGWNALIVIPLDALRVPHAGAQNWHVNFVRSVAAVNQHLSWAYNGLMNDAPAASWPVFGDARYWPASPRFTLESQTGARNDLDVYTLARAGAYPPGSRTRNLGFDYTNRFTPTASLVATVSPDYSNIELDQLTIAPQQYRQVLTEYRPFFSQGANYINSSRAQFIFNRAPDLLFYSPSIGQFDQGLKAEGRVGLNSFGAMEFSGPTPDGGRFADSVFGFARKAPDSSYALWGEGAFVHSDEISDDTVQVGAYKRNLARGLVLAGQYAIERGTAVTDPRHAYQSGFFGGIERPNLYFIAGRFDTGALYNPYAGYTNLADAHGPEMYLDVQRGGGSSRWLKSAEFILSADRFLDAGGNVHATNVDAYFVVHTTKLVKIKIADEVDGLRNYGGEHYSGAYGSYARSFMDRFGGVTGSLLFGEGTPNTFSLAQTVGPFAGALLHQQSGAVTHQFTRTLGASVAYAGVLASAPGGTHDGQSLWRYSLTRSIGNDGNLSVAYRTIVGRGGASAPGKNLAGSYHRKFGGDHEVWLNYGSPSALSTVDRWALKYVIPVRW